MSPPRAPLALALLAAGCGQVADNVFCDGEGCSWTREQWQQLRQMAVLADPPLDLSNRYTMSEDAARLGQRFFFDPAFSGVARQKDVLGRPTTLGRVSEGQPLKISCATCHDLQRGGVDVTSVPGNVSVGAGVTDVNALPVINSAYRKLFFWNGRTDASWCLNAIVAESDVTMNGNRLHTAHVIRERYAELETVFSAEGLPANWRELVDLWPADGKPGRVRDCQEKDPNEPFGDVYDCMAAPARALATQILSLWSKAIAAFEHRLVSRSSAFDQFVKEGPSSRKLSGAAQRGARLFVGKASCIDCHSGSLFTDDEFHNVGVPQIGPSVPTLADCPSGAPCDCDAKTNCFPLGAFNGITRLTDPNTAWVSWKAPNTDAPDSENPLKKMKPDGLEGAWRTPSLRDVALTAPYMHDGAFRTLEEVIWHYDTGGRESAAFAVGKPNVRLKPLGLTEGERADLVAFLQSLTGEPLPAALRSPP